MGVPAYLVASSVVAIMGQRLVRVICQKCKQPFKPSESSLESAGFPPAMLATATFFRGAGCGHCGGSGFRGRLGVYELMMMSPKVRELTFEEAPAGTIRQTAVSEGMKTLYMDGIYKVCRGLTTLDEVLRIARQTDE
jgi:type IV pilus assembly protein PilB